MELVFTFILGFFLTFMLVRFLKRSSMRRRIRREVRNEFNRQQQEEAIRTEERDKMYERNFDEGFLAEAGIHPHSWLGRPKRR